MTTEITLTTPADVAAAYGKQCTFERFLLAGSTDHNGYRYENIIPWNTEESVWVQQQDVCRAEHIKLAEQGYIRNLFTPQPAPRPLSSLTDTEIAECALLLNDDVKRWHEIEYRAFGKSRCIYSGYTVVRLVRYLDSIGIALGADGA